MRGVEHRRDVVDLARHRRDVLGDLLRPRRGDAEDRRAEERVRAGERLPALPQEADDRRLRRAPQSGEAHRGERAVGATDVVVEDLVDAELGRGRGERDVVALHGGAREIGEAAVARVGAAVGALHDLVAPAGLPCGFGVDRVAEADDPADHAHTEPVQPVERSLQVVDAELRADLLRERHAGRPADLARLVLQVELDRVDLLRAHEVEDALAERVVRPRIGGHVDRADRSFGAAGDDGHRHAPAAPVPGGVGGGQNEAAWRRRDPELEAAVAGHGH